MSALIRPILMTGDAGLMYGVLSSKLARWRLEHRKKIKKCFCQMEDWVVFHVI